MHVFASLLKFSQIFSYNFIKLATVFCFDVVFQKRLVKNFTNTIIALVAASEYLQNGKINEDKQQKY